MNQEEEKYIRDKRFPLVKAIFLRKLNHRKDIKISFSEAEETFLSLWIFLNKKNPHISTRFQEPVDFTIAETFYDFYIESNEQTREYLNNLLISFKTDRAVV